MRKRYQLTKKQFIILEVESPKELDIIKEMNNEFDKQKKKDITFHKLTISLDMLKEQSNFEIADEVLELDLYNEYIKQNFLRQLNCCHLSKS